MKLQQLMSGIGVVIDDKLSDGMILKGEVDHEGEDPIDQIAKWFMENWKLPLVCRKELPKEEATNLLQSASFVLLDWQLWGSVGEVLKKAHLNEIKRFLLAAMESLVPVIILTNESLEDVESTLEKLLKEEYDINKRNTNNLIVVNKSEFKPSATVCLEKLEKWVYGNASVYVLKTWQRVMEEARREFFKSMSDRSKDWPRVFWNTYDQDKVDCSSSLTQLINDNLQGRMRVGAFEKKHLDCDNSEVAQDELRQMIVETSFIQKDLLPENEVRCGDVYKLGDKYWLNLRPDCDCIPRKNAEVEDIEVYCVEGKALSRNKEAGRFNHDYGNFDTNPTQSIVFGIANGKSILFKFSKLHVCKFSEVKENRIGRLLHPYLTKVQQQYASFSQRQGLPRIPNEAVDQPPDRMECKTPDCPTD